MRGVVIVLALLLVLLAVLALTQRLPAPVKALFLVVQEFPQIPIKPLYLLSAAPTRRQVRLDAPHGAIVADVFLPNQLVGQVASKSRPAVVIAMGVKTAERDRPLLLHLGDTLSRLGYVAVWPRSEILDQGTSTFEEPETFVRAILYAAGLEPVDPRRISLAGFSIGSSIALVAAADPRVTNQVRAAIFFGGYYDAFDYLVSLASGTVQLDGAVVSWSPAEGAVNHGREIFETWRAAGLLRVLEAQTRDEAQRLLAAASADERATLAKLSPAAHIDRVRARVFILHDKSDPYVHYSESIKLARALEPRGGATFLLANLFEHVQPRRELALDLLREFLRLYGFLSEVFTHL